ncbi:NAD-dependent epimerase/dehydratase family protein [bacterium]|nr:NAD-dependent epimerase/dehydratase family protein [bacterium]
MNARRVLITGGAGFIGSNLAVFLKESYPSIEVYAFDNLIRQGSRENLPRLKRMGIEFIQGDVRSAEDMSRSPVVDVMVLAAAEPSVQAGIINSPVPVLETNLLGTIRSLELAASFGADVLLLSTSRVYPIERVNEIPYRKDATRFVWSLDGSNCPSGWSTSGLRPDFSLEGRRSFYGASKLGAEMLLQEYAGAGRIRGLINRCGLVTGPWQMARADQGVVALWVMHHLFDKPLRYIGFGGTGKQVRDCLDVYDLCRLVARQLECRERWTAQVYHASGGTERSISLTELTELCRQLTGRQLMIGSEPDTSQVDVRILIMDSSEAQRDFDWQPERSLNETLQSLQDWMVRERPMLERTLT